MRIFLCLFQSIWKVLHSSWGSQGKNALEIDHENMLSGEKTNANTSRKKYMHFEQISKNANGNQARAKQLKIHVWKICWFKWWRERETEGERLWDRSMRARRRIQPLLLVRTILNARKSIIRSALFIISIINDHFHRFSYRFYNRKRWARNSIELQCMCVRARAYALHAHHSHRNRSFPIAMNLLSRQQTHRFHEFCYAMRSLHDKISYQIHTRFAINFRSSLLCRGTSFNHDFNKLITILLVRCFSYCWWWRGFWIGWLNDRFRLKPNRLKLQTSSANLWTME